MTTRTAPGEDEATGQAERLRIRRGILYCLAVFVAARVGLSIVAALGVALIDPLEPTTDSGWRTAPFAPGWHSIVTAWERFDALWFLRISEVGYVQPKSAVFFPLYPLAIRAVSPLLGGHPLAAAIVVGNAAYIGGLIATFFLTAGEWGERVARRTILYLAIFPTAFFLLAPYSEPLFLLLVTTSLWGARRGRWAIAGIAAALAAMTRNLGIVLVLPLAFEAWHQHRQQGTRLFPTVLWSLLPAAGLLAYLGYWEVAGGSWRAPFELQEQWERAIAFPPWTVIQATYQAFRWIGVYPGGYHLLDWLIVVPMLVAGVWVARRARPIFSLYTWASLLVPLSFVFAPRPFMSLPRFLLPIVPLFWAAAVVAERRPWLHEAVVVASSALLGVMTVLFVSWYYVF